MFSLAVMLALTTGSLREDRAEQTTPAAVAEVGRRVGLTIDPAGLKGVPAAHTVIWAAVEGLARANSRRVVVSPDGRRVTFAPGPPSPAAIDGAFRLAVRSVTCRHDYDAGPPVCEVGLDLHWEPRLAVVRVADAGGKAAVTGALHRTTLRLTGVPRSAATLPRQEVAFTVTAAERLVTFTVPDLAAPKPLTVEGITLTPRPARRLDSLWEVRLRLLYPEGHPEFESFESWTANNRCRLVHRDGRTLATDDREESHTGRGVEVAYRFKAAEVGDLAGWSLVLDTPGPLREFPVRFTLRDVPLP